MLVSLVVFAFYRTSGLRIEFATVHRDVLLLITLAASFFVDLANATITKLFLMLPLFE